MLDAMVATLMLNVMMDVALLLSIATYNVIHTIQPSWYTYMHTYVCTYVNVNVNDSGFLTILSDAPVVTIDPSQSPHTVSVGTRLFLNCETHGQPIPMVQWYKGTTAVSYSVQQFHQSYRVTTSTPHSSVYSCVATNNASNTTHTVHKSIKVIVQSKSNICIYHTK